MLRRVGPCSVYALAKAADRNCSNVHTDIARLEVLGLVERTAEGAVFAGAAHAAARICMSMCTAAKGHTTPPAALRSWPEDRARLADLLLASLPDEAEEPLGEEWDQEIQRRLKAVESGTTRLVSAADVHAEARKIYQR